MMPGRLPRSHQRTLRRVWRTPLAVNPGPHRTVLGCDYCASPRPSWVAFAPLWSDHQRKTTMKLITNEQRTKLLDNGAAAARGEERDPHPVVKLFTADANATWLLTELDPGEPDRAFGLCDLGLGCPELGYVLMSEL